MLITSKAEFIWSDRQEKYILVRRESRPFNGHVALCKGATAAQNNLAQQQSNFYSTLTNDYGQQFANQSQILNSLNRSLSPIVAAGPNQFGFNTPEVNNLNSQAIQGTAQAYAGANQALKEQQAAQGGGNTLLPSGVANQQQAQVAAAAAGQQSNQLLGIQQAGYNAGRQQYNQAVGELGGVASMYNPTGFAGQASTAGNDAFNSATKIQEENAAASPWNVVGGILGGAVGAGLDAFTGGIGGSLATSATCPAKGSLFLMADGSEKPVEDLKVGDKIAGLDDEPQVIEEIQIGPLPVVKVTTENGHTTRNSTIHAFALPKGGFVIAARSLGKTVVTAEGHSKVISVAPDGEDTIYNVITDGSHTYRADGVWALGQGEGERSVSTEAWTKISHQVMVPEVNEHASV